ncbi:hypothetical protein OA187_04390, partial [Candidatus Pelagibacter sp.]|nr:hypothetical protein [Candidatus Pelagibacter sp.]
FALIFLFLFILIHENKIKSKFEIFLFVFLLSFYSSGKIYYVFFSLLLVAYFLFKNKKSYKYFFSFGIVNFVFIFLPIFFLKYKYFGNPLAPFFDEILGNSRYVFIKYAFALRESQGWISNYDNLLIYIKPFIPTKIADLTNTLGLIFLLLLLNFKLQKNLKFFPIFIILIIASTGNILSRYFFEAFLLLSFYYINERNSLINLIKNLQLLIIFCFVTSYLYISYVNYNVIGDKNKYMNNFSYSYYNNKKYASLSNENKILTLSQDRANIFYSDNIIPRSYLRMKGIDKGQNLDLINFVNENNISYIILIPNEKNLLPNCLTDNLVGDINEHKASRNFLVKSGELTHIYKVNENKC